MRHCGLVTHQVPYVPLFGSPTSKHSFWQLKYSEPLDHISPFSQTRLLFSAFNAASGDSFVTRDLPTAGRVVDRPAAYKSQTLSMDSLPVLDFLLPQVHTVSATHLTDIYSDSSTPPETNFNQHSAHHNPLHQFTTQTT
jgi:hypothetical protein